MQPASFSSLQLLGLTAALVEDCNRGAPRYSEEPLMETVANLVRGGMALPTKEVFLDRALDLVAWADEAPAAPSEDWVRRFIGTAPRVSETAPDSAERVMQYRQVVAWYERSEDEEANVGDWKVKYECHRRRTALRTGVLYAAPPAPALPDETMELWRDELLQAEIHEDAALIEAALAEARPICPVAVREIEHDHHSAWARYNAFIENRSREIWGQFEHRYESLYVAPPPLRPMANQRTSRASGTHRRGSRRSSSSDSSDPGGSDADDDVAPPPHRGRI